MATALDEINLSDPMFWAAPWAEREAAFARLRADDPIRFFEEAEVPPLPKGRGYYALTRHADVLAASKQPALFCSGEGSNIGDMPPDFLEFFGSMINLDDPRHARLRKIVSAAFTPRMLKQVEDSVDERARRIVADVAPKGGGDFVTEVAARLPLEIICDMMGIGPDLYDFVFDRTNIILGPGDPEYIEATDDPNTIITALLTAGFELSELVKQMGRDRLETPTDDLTSALVHAEVDGERLTPEELGSFFVLLVVAGNETTRNAISHGLLALSEHEDQLEAWQKDFDALAPTAVEEIVRWATPVIHFRRTCTTDGARIGDREFSAGDKVVLFYNSANRDERLFANPDRFDIRRAPNDHVGFGGPGPHFCLGAHLARREITVMFRELFRSLPQIRATGEPARLQSNFINGIKHLPAAW